jgi:hypothetical protein
VGILIFNEETNYQSIPAVPIPPPQCQPLKILSLYFISQISYVAEGRRCTHRSLLVIIVHCRRKLFHVEKGFYSSMIKDNGTEEHCRPLELGMSRLIGTADKSADIWRFQNNR